LKKESKDSTVKTEKLLKLRKRKINSNIEETKIKEKEASIKTEEKIQNESKKTVFIKGLSPLTTEESIKTFILSLLPSANINDIRLVRDRKGVSKGFSFVDFADANTAHQCSKILNNKIIEENSITCAVSKPPKFGENDKRTIFVNNISYASTEESIKAAFEPFGQILDVRIITDKVNYKPKGYCYVEFLEEESIEKVMENKLNFIVDNRKVIIKSSQSVTKLRENIKYVAHVTNLPFALSEEKLKKFFISNGAEGITDCLITKDDEGNSKGFGFVEFNSQVFLLLINKEYLHKALSLSGKIIKGRPITVKLSNRNITRNNKRKANSDLESIIKVKKLRRTE
jgi:RNA recognition motif-containing protein